jgi:hypothetical protein
LSVPVSSVRVMGKGRRVRKERATERYASGSADRTLRDAICLALAGGHPLDLLSMACMVIHVAKPESPISGRCVTTHWDRVLDGMIGVKDRETTALLAVIAELLVDDPGPQLRCRRAVAERSEHLPRWIAALPRVDVYRAVRRTNVFGDVDELVIGMRLDGGHELTIAVDIDHNIWSSVDDAGAVPEPIDYVLAHVAESSTDTEVFEMTLANARVWLEDALDKPRLAAETDTWPLYRALVQWLMSRLPEGGEHRSPPGAWELHEALCDRFFATDCAAPFTDPSHRDLLLELFDTGTGDALRWSAARVERAIGGSPYREDHMPLEVALDAPDLLRAFIPYAHAQSGIRDELTSRTLAVVDGLRSSYKRKVLRQAKFWDVDDVG